jgi:hypothetical protein
MLSVTPMTEPICEPVLKAEASMVSFLSREKAGQLTINIIHPRLIAAINENLFCTNMVFAPFHAC